MRFQLTTAKYRFAAAFYLFLVYAFGVFSKSAWSDDFSALFDPDAVALHAIRDSRIVYGWLVDFLFGSFTTIQSLAFIKLLGLLGLILLNDLLINNLLKIKMSAGVVIASTLAFTLPSFQFTAHWAITFMLSWTAYLAVVGYINFSKKTFANRVLGLLLFTTSMLLYPLMTFFIFPYIYVLWFVRKSGHKTLLIKTGMAIMLTVCASFTSYAFSFLYLRINNLDFNSRVAFVSIDELPQKIAFFFSRPFALAYRPFLIDSPSLFGLLLTVMFFISLLLLLFWTRSRSIRRAALEFILFNFFVALAIIPLLVVSQNQIDMRFVASNTWLYVFVTVYLLAGFLKDVRVKYHWLPRFTPYLVLGALLSVGALTTNYYFWDLFYNPYNVKREFLHQQLSNCSKAQIQHRVYIFERTIEWPHLQNIGAYSQITDLESSWVPVGAVAQYLKETNMPRVNSPALVSHRQDSSGCEIKLDEYPSR